MTWRWKRRRRSGVPRRRVPPTPYRCLGGDGYRLPPPSPPSQRRLIGRGRNSFLLLPLSTRLGVSSTSRPNICPDRQTLERRTAQNTVPSSSLDSSTRRPPRLGKLGGKGGERRVVGDDRRAAISSNRVNRWPTQHTKSARRENCRERPHHRIASGISATPRSPSASIHFLRLCLLLGVCILTDLQECPVDIG